MKQKPFVSIIVPTHNRKQKLARLIRSILQSDSSSQSIEIIVVDDASTDGTHAAIKKQFPNVRVIRNKKQRMVSGARNVGINFSRGEYLFFVDDDYVIDGNVISELVDLMETEKNMGTVGPIIYYYGAPQKIFCAGGKLRRPLYITTLILQGKESDVIESENIRLIECDFVSTPFMMRRQIVEEIGFFDEVNFPIWGEEIDFSLRIREKGYRQVILPRAKVWHDVPTARDYHLTEERAFFRGRSRVRFSLKYAWPRILLLPVDMLSFCYILFGYNRDARVWKKFLLYFRGIIQGFALSKSTL